MEQKTHLLDLYRRHPCRTLPNAWWKTGKRLPNLQIEINEDDQGQLKALTVQENGRVLALWCREPAECTLLPTDLTESPMILAHADSLDCLAGIPFSRSEAYFRLIHEGTPPETTCPPQFHYATADPFTEADTIAGLIRDCYPGSEMTAKEVAGWTHHPVYDSTLWVWVRETATRKPVGLGIAEFDPEIPEASLE